jgi:OOP family OmpA-OmpF porin
MGSLGGRVGYYPLSWLGFEGEIGGFPGSVRDGGYVQLIHARGHALFQLPFRLTPFLLGGMGTLIVNDDADRLGTEQDPAAHIGAGGRFYVNDWFNLRLEWRGTLAPRSDGATNRSPSLHNEILLSLGFVFGPKHREAPAPPAQAVDGDGDGFLEPADKCPNEPGVAPDGCPPADRDGDGFDNEVDACPDDPGIAPDGCPTKDRDKDGITDENDLCIDEPGIEPDGCPIKDSDGDQILDPDDKCPNEPETRNGFEDTDGCPDEVPEEVVKFTGVIQGIYFAVNRAALKSESYAVLKEAVEVLKKHPTIRIEVVGHTDSTGSDAFNRDLSLRRAEAVADYLVSRGVSRSALTPVGRGEAMPIATNDTATGRANNRRVELVISADEGTQSGESSEHMFPPEG